MLCWLLGRKPVGQLPPAPSLTGRNQFRSDYLLKLSLKRDIPPDVTWCCKGSQSRERLSSSSMVGFGERPTVAPGQCSPWSAHSLSHFPFCTHAHPTSRALVVDTPGFPHPHVMQPHRAAHPFLDLLPPPDCKFSIASSPLYWARLETEWDQNTAGPQ